MLKWNWNKTPKQPERALLTVTCFSLISIFIRMLKNVHNDVETSLKLFQLFQCFVLVLFQNVGTSETKLKLNSRLKREKKIWFRSISDLYTLWNWKKTKLSTVDIIIIVTRSVQPEPPAVAIVRQNGRSSASCRTSVAVTGVSRQIWWVQVVDGRSQARLHSCEGRSPSLVFVQISRIWFAGTSCRSLATWPKRPSFRLQTMYVTRRRNRPVDAGLHRWIRRWHDFVSNDDVDSFVLFQNVRRA